MVIIPGLNDSKLGLRKEVEEYKHFTTFKTLQYQELFSRSLFCKKID